jgi:hypothetical protein
MAALPTLPLNPPYRPLPRARQSATIVSLPRQAVLIPGPIPVLTPVAADPSEGRPLVGRASGLRDTAAAWLVVAVLAVLVFAVF